MSLLSKRLRPRTILRSSPIFHMNNSHQSIVIRCYTAEIGKSTGNESGSFSSLKNVFNISIPQLTRKPTKTANLDKKTDAGNRSVNDSVSNTNAENSADQQPVNRMEQLKESFGEGNHKKVVSIWLDHIVAGKLPVALDELNMLLVSAENSDKRIQDIIENAIAYYFRQNFANSPEYIDNFLDMCKKMKYGWYYASYALSVICELEPNPKFTASTPRQIEQYYITVATLCNKQGKWRTSIDLLKSMLKQKIEFTSPVLKIVVMTCCKESILSSGIGENSTGEKAMIEAYAIFSYMVKKSLLRDYEMYLHLLISLNREKLYERAEKVWIQLRIDCSVTGNQLLKSDGSTANSKPSSSSSSASANRSSHSIQLNDPLYACYIHILCGLKQYDKAIEMYKNVFKRLKNPLHSYVAISSGLRQASLSNPDIKPIGDKYSLKLTSQYVVARARHLLEERDYKSVVNYICGELSRDDLRLVPHNIWNEIFNQILQQGMIDESIELMIYLRSWNQEIDHSSADNSTSHSMILVQLDNWIVKIMRELGKMGEVDEALKLAHREGKYFTDDAFTALMILLIENDKIPISMQLLKKRFIHSSNQSEENRQVPYSMAYAAIKSIVRVSSYEHLPLLLSIVQQSLSVISTSASVKGMANIINYEPKQLEASLKSLEIKSTSYIAYTSPRITSVVVSLLQHEQNNGIVPTWEQVKIVIKTLALAMTTNTTSRLANADQLVYLFALRTQSDDYIRGDERMYELAMKACAVMGKWELTIELFGDLLQEKKRPSANIFEIVIVQLMMTGNQSDAQLQQHYAGALAEIYTLMSGLKIRPTSKAETILLKHLPKDLKYQLQLESALYKNLPNK